MPSPRPGQRNYRTTTQRGLGAAHRQDRERLLQQHVEGTTCWWCGEPMFTAQGLGADHEQPRSLGGTRANRLLHSWCNSERGDGRHDDERPAVTGLKLNGHAQLAIGERAMRWAP